jgi:hypothetical protein
MRVFGRCGQSPQGEAGASSGLDRRRHFVELSANGKMKLEEIGFSNTIARSDVCPVLKRPRDLATDEQ